MTVTPATGTSGHVPPPHQASTATRGRALKTGFAHVRERFPGEAVVCADSDDQHRTEGIDAVAQKLNTTDAAMVLGACRFTGSVPARSRFGTRAGRAAAGGDGDRHDLP